MSDPAPIRAPSVAIIGGGISGLAAAHHILRIAKARRSSVDVTVLESTERIGGVIRSERSREFLFEFGADSILAAKPHGRAYAESLGLADEIIGANPEFRRSYITRGNQLHPVPEGMNLFTPSKVIPLLRSPLFSSAGKLRMLAELALPRRDDTDDESLADFVRRRFGNEALERLAQPLAGGIYTADPERLSMQATMLRFTEMERRHRSLLWSMLRRRMRGEDDEALAAAGPRHALFMSFRDGIETLPKRLADRLPAGSVRTKAGVERIEATADGWRIHAREFELNAQAVCLAVPAHAAGVLLRPIDSELAAELQRIPYASTATLNIVLDAADVPRALDGYGFVVPAVEGRATIACTFANVKYTPRAPRNKVVLRAFVGGALAPQALEQSDDRIVEQVMADLKDLLGVTAKPGEVLIARWPDSMAQYLVGHRERVESIRTMLARHAGLQLAGNAYDGVGIPDCIRSAEAAAESLADLVLSNPLKQPAARRA